MERVNWSRHILDAVTGMEVAAVVGGGLVVVVVEVVGVTVKGYDLPPLSQSQTGSIPNQTDLPLHPPPSFPKHNDHSPAGSANNGRGDQNLKRLCFAVFVCVSLCMTESAKVNGSM
ncbi:unnamed protein product [Pleuronectes platessa]|uniref:Uncharacterized protein n=1 Tax=Pleuronectes platessa TaxID=8262 RepID=A0A9N7YGY3_PLEPL|nr:unnamed protein product [Pleuronectes platessa]